MNDIELKDTWAELSPEQQQKINEWATDNITMINKDAEHVTPPCIVEVCCHKCKKAYTDSERTPENIAIGHALKHHKDEILSG